MAERGAQPGNKNATKGKPWQDAINRALARYEVADPDGKREARKGLDAIADRIVRMAGEGDITAIKELGDRVEGKVPQRIEATGADGVPLLPPTISIAPPR